MSTHTLKKGSSGWLTLLAGSTPETAPQLQSWLVQAALFGPIRVVVAGGYYPHYAINYQVASAGKLYESQLAHIHFVRAETVYQVGTALKKLNAAEGPVFIFDLFDTFYSADIDDLEAHELFIGVRSALLQLKMSSSIIVSARREAAFGWLFRSIELISDEVIPMHYKVPHYQTRQLQLWE